MPAAGMPIALSLGLFFVAAAATWFAGTRLAGYADELADRRRWGKAFAGLVFLAAATELPEVVTTATAALTGNAQLLINNLLGGVSANTVLLALADGFAVGAALTFYPRKSTPLLQGILLILLLALTASVAIVGDRAVVAHVGFGSLAIGVAYVTAIVILQRAEGEDGWRAIEIPEEPAGAPVHPWRAVLAALPERVLWLRISLATAVILACGWGLIVLSDDIAEKTGLGDSFVGATLLAVSTSLPEMSTTIMAVRLRSYTMAISNIFGSNLIMLILFLPSDILYRDGPILAEAGPLALLSLCAGIVLTGIMVAGLAIRSRRTILGMGRDSALVLAAYPLILAGFYLLR